MIDLNEITPSMFVADAKVTLDLDRVYKEHSMYSHLHALETIFAEGVRFAMANNIMKQKYEALLSRVSDMPISDADDKNAQREAVLQTMGMGEVFKK